jgi:hypothetical protein
VSDRPEDPFDAPVAAENPAEEARGLRALLGRHAVDTRPLRIPEYRRILIGQGTSFIGSMLTQVAVRKTDGAREGRVWLRSPCGGCRLLGMSARPSGAPLAAD